VLLGLLDNLFKEARAIDDGIASGDCEVEVLEGLLEVTILVGGEVFNSWSFLEMLRVVEASDVLALVADIIVLVD
jgi:hypothetical protein